MLQKSSLVFFFMVLLACHRTDQARDLGRLHEPVTSGVINGDVVDPSELVDRALVLIRTDDGYCSGVMLTEDLVLTAAHFFDVGGNLQQVVLRGDNDGCGAVTSGEVEFAPGADLDEDGVHDPDLALVRLPHRLCGARPVKLADVGDDADKLISAGFGRGNRSKTRAERLELRRIDPGSAEIQELYEDARASERDSVAKWSTPKNVINYRFALPVRAGKSLCHGDSGGPVYRELDDEIRLVGVNEAVLRNSEKGVSECNFAFVQVFTAIEPSRAWLERAINND